MNTPLRRAVILAVTLPFALACPAAAQPPPKYGEILTWGPGGGLAGAPAGPFVKIAAGPTHALALRADGTAAGWGQNQHGQANPPPGQFIALAAGGVGSDGRSFGLRPGGTPEIWGLTTGFPAAPTGPFTKIRASYDYALLIRADGSLAYWGPPSPLAVVPPGTFTDAAPGKDHAVALRADGTLEAWGDNTFGQLSVPPGAGFVSVASGAAHSLAADTSGTVFAWGRDNAGQAQAPPFTFALVVAAREDWSCALGGGGLLTWGNDPEPQLGYIPGLRLRGVAPGDAFGIALMGCYADCNGSGTLTISDFGCFRTPFVAGGPYADCTGDGHINVADFGCFQTRFVADSVQTCLP